MIERAPKFRLGAATVLGDRLERKKEAPVREIGAFHDVLDAIQDDRSRGIEQHFVLIGVKLARREAATGRESAERVGDPRWQA